MRENTVRRSNDRWTGCSSQHCASMIAIMTSNRWEYGVLITFSRQGLRLDEYVHGWAFETTEGIEHGEGEWFDLFNALGKQGWRYREVDDRPPLADVASSRLINHLRGFGIEHPSCYWLFERSH